MVANGGCIMGADIGYPIKGYACDAVCGIIICANCGIMGHMPYEFATIMAAMFGNCGFCCCIIWTVAASGRGGMLTDRDDRALDRPCAGELP